MPELENVFDVLDARGFVAQVTDADNIRAHLQAPTTCYIGFDPTADSLHIGSLVPILALVHMQRHGHRPIVLVGGGTGLVGDPSGKTEMRKLLGLKEIDANVAALKGQLSQFLDFSDDRALLLNNADWLLPLGYIEFLRDIGKHFSVNRMLAAESYKMRLETGLNFIEFNYMLLQAYDFLHLYEHHQCVLQLGGNDQWGNILAGIDLVRRMHNATVYGLTLPLITTASGAKMGKTEKGAVWLDPEKTSPYDYYQYWVNVDDRDVKRFFLLFTFLPPAEIDALVNRAERDGWNTVKQTLAYEITSLTHGRSAAEKARESALSVFYGDGSHIDSLPASTYAVEKLRGGIPAFVLFADTGLCSSRSEARRLIEKGGGYVNGRKLASFDEKITETFAKDGIILLRAGKKKYHKIVLA